MDRGEKRFAFNAPLFTPAEAEELGPAAETIFLGLLDGAPRFGHGLAPQSAEVLKGRNDLLVTDLRSIAVQGLVAADDLPPIAEAKAMLHWHVRHRFCPNCGAATRLVCGWLAARLPAVQGRAFSAHRSGGDHAGDRRRPLPARPQSALRADMWSCLAGFIEPGEIDRRCGAAGNAARKPESPAVAWSISPRSLGRSRHR